MSIVERICQLFGHRATQVGLGVSVSQRQRIGRDYCVVSNRPRFMAWYNSTPKPPKLINVLSF